MTGAVRQPFDASATFVVAKESLVCGPSSKRFHRGETVPLRELGCTDLDIWHLYNGQDIDCVAATAPVTVQPKQPQPAKPTQQQQRRGR